MRRIAGKQKSFGAKLTAFLQSYLHWMWLQNPRLDEYLTTDEIVNYLFHQMELPVWFQLLQRNQPWDLMTTVHRLIASNKHRADTFTLQMAVFPLANVKGMVEVEWPNEQPSPLQIKNLNAVCTRYGFKLPPHVTSSDCALTMKMTRKEKEK